MAPWLVLWASHAVAQGTEGASANAGKSDLRAQRALEGPGDDAKVHARALFDKGVAAYSEGRYFDAVDLFLEVNRIFPNPELSFNVAKAYDNLGDQGGALRYYREYLSSVPQASDRKDVSARIRQLEQALNQKGVQQLTVTSRPEGATVVLDGRPIGVTPWTGETWPGRHRIRLWSEGYQDAERVVELERLRSQQVELALAPALRPVATPVVPARIEQSRPAQASQRRVGPMTWVMLAVGAASLAAAGVYQMQTGSGDGGITRPSAFLAGVGTAATVGGGLMLCFDLSSSSSSGRRARLGLGGPALAWDWR